MAQRSNIPVWAVALAGGGAALAVVLGLLLAVSMPPASPSGAIVRTSGTAAIGGDFTLVDQNGEAFTQDDLKGRPSLIYFGYSFCPDVCPLSLQVMNAAIGRLPARQQDQVLPVFMSVDPERDTVEQMRAYAATPGFPQGLAALTGTPEQVEAAKDVFRIYSTRGAEAGDFYLVDHTSLIYLMDADGRFVTAFGHAESPETIAAAVRGLIG